jgi:hypothetical protein
VKQKTKEKIGVQKDSHPDKDFHPFWSWRCKCGEWNDMYPFRWLARLDYRDHRAHCEVRTKVTEQK